MKEGTVVKVYGKLATVLQVAGKGKRLFVDDGSRTLWVRADVAKAVS